MKAKGRTRNLDNQAAGGQPEEGGRKLPRRERKAQAISAGASGTLATILTRPRLAENGPDHGDGDESPRDAGALGRDSGQSVAAAEAGASRGASRETPSPQKQETQEYAEMNARKGEAGETPAGPRKRPSA